MESRDHRDESGDTLHDPLARQEDDVTASGTTYPGVSTDDHLSGGSFATPLLPPGVGQVLPNTENGWQDHGDPARSLPFTSSGHQGRQMPFLTPHRPAALGNRPDVDLPQLLLYMEQCRTHDAAIRQLEDQRRRDEELQRFTAMKQEDQRRRDEDLQRFTALIAALRPGSGTSPPSGGTDTFGGASAPPPLGPKVVPLPPPCCNRTLHTRSSVPGGRTGTISSPTTTSLPASPERSS